jgi:thiamine pyrophosphate-dependent acetolactate synthase large subunit-like protein
MEPLPLEVLAMFWTPAKAADALATVDSLTPVYNAAYAAALEATPGTVTLVAPGHVVAEPYAKPSPKHHAIALMAVVDHLNTIEAALRLEAIDDTYALTRLSIEAAAA